MVTCDAQRHAIFHHGHHQFQHIRDARPTVDQIADEHGLAPIRMGDRIAGFAVGANPRGQLIPEAFEKQDEFFETTVHVADDVERPFSSWRLVHNGTRSMVTAATSSGELST